MIKDLEFSQLSLKLLRFFDKVYNINEDDLKDL